MARLFGALANARAQYNQGKFKREQYDAQQEAAARKEARRALEFKLTQDRLSQQQQMLDQDRDEARTFREQQEVARRMSDGWEEDTLGPNGAAGYIQPLPQNGASQAGAVRRTQIGSKALRYDPQRAANESARAMMEKYALQQASEAEKIRAQGDQRKELAILAASLRGGQGGSAAPARAPQRPTGAQEQSYLYANLLKDGNEVMAQFGKAVRPEVIGAYVNKKWFKPALTPEEQQYMQGARSFAAGVLRKESGAAIKEDELRDVMARYIDMPFDAPATRELKRKARERYQGSLERLATPARAYYGEDEPSTGTSRSRETQPSTGTPTTTPKGQTPPWLTKKGGS